MSQKYFQTRGSLRNQCGFSELDFNTLWRHVRGDLNDPGNIIGLEGPKKHGEAWDVWVERYINGGLAGQYWGEGTERKWNLTENSEEIVGFLLLLLKHAAQTNRAASVLAQVKQESIDAPGMAGSLAVREDSFASPATQSKDTNTLAAQGRRVKRKAIDSLPNRLVLTNDNSPEDSGHIQKGDVEAAHILGQGKRLRRRSNSDMMRKEGESTLDSTKKIKLSVSSTGFGPSLDPINLRPVISSEVSISPTKKPSPAARIRTEALTVSPSEPFERVFETNIAGTNQLRIIYAVQAPTLEKFIGKVYEKYALGPQQKISGIDVWAGSDFISVDLEEEKDWIYITSCVARNGVRVKVVVWTV